MKASVDIKIKGETDPEYALGVTLTNKSGAQLTTYEHSLPWVGLNSLILIAVKTDVLGTLLDKPSPIDDPGPASLTIQPGETVTGRIPLTHRFPGFVEALKGRDVIVFWSYQFKPIDSSPLKRTGGYVLFPKAGN